MRAGVGRACTRQSVPLAAPPLCDRPALNPPVHPVLMAIDDPIQLIGVVKFKVNTQNGWVMTLIIVQVCFFISHIALSAGSELAAEGSVF